MRPVNCQRMITDLWHRKERSQNRVLINWLSKNCVLMNWLDIIFVACTDPENSHWVQLQTNYNHIFSSQHSVLSSQRGPVMFLAHLSQRLIGELIGYSWSGVRPSSSVGVVRRPSLTISNVFFSKTACLINVKFYVEPPWVGGTKVCSRHLGHMTKMAARPIYGKNPSKIFFSRTGRQIFTKLGM